MTTRFGNERGEANKLRNREERLKKLREREGEDEKQIPEKKESLARRFLTKDKSMKNTREPRVDLTIVFYGVWLEDEEYGWLRFNFRTNKNRNEIMKKAFKKAHIKANIDDFSAYRQQSVNLEELGQDSIDVMGLKDKDLVHIRPKSYISLILPNNVSEVMHLDFNTPIIHLLYSIGNLLGKDDVEHYLLSPSRDSKDYYDVSKSLNECGLMSGDALALIEDKSAAIEAKTNARKNRKLSSVPKKPTNSNEEGVFAYKSAPLCVSQLETHPSVTNLLQILVSLSTTNTWYNSFVTNNGLTVLFQSLSYPRDKIE